MFKFNLTPESIYLLIENIKVLVLLRYNINKI